MFRVKVTKKHINFGMMGDSDQCPIALALRGKGFEKVCVGTTDTYFEVLNGKSKSYSYYLPKKARQFIEDFDNAGDVSPIEFVLKEITK